MAQQADLTIQTRGTANGAAAATVTYKPVFASFAVANAADKTQRTLESLWEERSAGTAIGFSTLNVLSRPANGKNIQRTKLALVIPTLEVSAPSGGAGGFQPAPKVAYTCEYRGEFLLPSRATAAEKWECYARAKSSLDQAFMLAMTRDNEQVS